MFLQSILLTASLAGFAAATAVVPLPTTGQAQLSAAKLKHRQTSRLDIARRASHAKKFMRRQDGPSAIPVPTIFCGSTPAFETFYLSTPDPEDPARFKYIYSSTSDIDEFGSAAFAFTDEESLATAYVFDNQCRLSASNSMQQGIAWVARESSISDTRIGTEAFIVGQNGISLACADEDGDLRCGTTEGFLPIDAARFCQSTTGTLQLTVFPPEQSNCVPLALSISNVPPIQPPQPEIPICGDQLVGREFYLSTSSPFESQVSRLYGITSDESIAQGGASVFFPSLDYASATPFIFDTNCALLRVTESGLVGRLAAASEVQITTPFFATPDFIDNNAFEIFTCTSTDRTLRCGTSNGNLPAATSDFCLEDRFGSGPFGFTSLPSGPRCTRVALSLSTSPPPPAPTAN